LDRFFHSQGWPTEKRTDHQGGGFFNSLWLRPFNEHSLLSEVRLPITDSQRDISPTVLELMGIKSPPEFPGKSLLQTSVRGFSDYYRDGILGWIEGNRSVEISVVNAEIIDCLERTSTWKVVDCRPEDDDLRSNALVFTDYSQGLLFNRELNRFGDFN